LSSFPVSRKTRIERDYHPEKNNREWPSRKGATKGGAESFVSPSRPESSLREIPCLFERISEKEGTIPRKRIRGLCINGWPMHICVLREKRP